MHDPEAGSVDRRHHTRAVDSLQRVGHRSHPCHDGRRRRVDGGKAVDDSGELGLAELVSPLHEHESALGRVGVGHGRRQGRANGGCRILAVEPDDVDPAFHRSVRDRVTVNRTPRAYVVVMSLIPDRNPGTTIAIVLGGGSGTRFGSETNKVLVSIGERPVLGWSLDTLQRCEHIDAVVVVIRAGDEGPVDSIIADTQADKVVAVVPGGETRQASEWAGIRAAADLGLDGLITILLHDAARPFLTVALIERLVDGDPAVEIGAIPAHPVTDALIDEQGRLVPADELVRVQTPQAFRLDVLLERYPRAEAEGFTGADTAETVQHHGPGVIRWVPSDPDNIKVTHPEDRVKAEQLARSFSAGAWSNQT